jgi:hypothetical protein
LRAIAAIIDNNGYGDDPDLSYLIRRLKPFVLRFEELSTEDINKILHNDRKISPLVLSSGQQELLYLLLLIGHSANIGFKFGRRISIFIEEQSAHLFPLEQKEAIEFIVKIFRELMEDITRLNRFFITTHSPYILNVINNMLDSSLSCNVPQQTLYTAFGLRRMRHHEGDTEFVGDSAELGFGENLPGQALFRRPVFLFFGIYEENPGFVGVQFQRRQEPTSVCLMSSRYPAKHSFLQRYRASIRPVLSSIKP